MTVDQVMVLASYITSVGAMVLSLFTLYTLGNEKKKD
jgi:hypothetical protein